MHKHPSTADLWEPPKLVDRLNSDSIEETEQSSTLGWYDALVDLVFVVIISQLSGLFHEFSYDNISAFFILTTAALNIWTREVNYNARFKHAIDDLLARILGFFFLTFCCIFAGNVFRGFDHITGISIGAAGANAVVLVFYIRGLIAEGSMDIWRQFLPILSGIILEIGVWIMLCCASQDIALWHRQLSVIAAIVLGLLPGIIIHVFFYTQFPALSQNRDYLCDRYGLFIIIVLGEIIDSIVQGAREAALVDNEMYVEVVLAACSVFCIWWIYFDNQEIVVFRRRHHYVSFCFAHGFFAMSLTGISAGYYSIFSLKSSDPVSLYSLWLFCGFAGGTVLFQNIIIMLRTWNCRTVTVRPCGFVLHLVLQCFFPLLLVVLPLLNRSFLPWHLCLIFFVVMVLRVITDTWFKQKGRSRRSMMNPSRTRSWSSRLQPLLVPSTSLHSPRLNPFIRGINGGAE